MPEEIDKCNNYIENKDKTMTREEAKKLLPIIQAFAKGKVIQCKSSITNEWRDFNEPAFNGLPDNYRIKPEPKYRPFKSQEECWNEMHKHSDFGWVKNKNTQDYCNITDLYKSQLRPAKISVNNYEYTLNELFNSFTFTDGTPFGIKEE